MLGGWNEKQQTQIDFGWPFRVARREQQAPRTKPRTRENIYIYDACFAKNQDGTLKTRTARVRKRRRLRFIGWLDVLRVQSFSPPDVVSPLRLSALSAPLHGGAHAVRLVILLSRVGGAVAVAVPGYGTGGGGGLARKQRMYVYMLSFRLFRGSWI